MGNFTLNNSVHNPLLLWICAPSGEIPRDWLVYLNQASFFIDNMELVLVNELVVSSTKLTDGLIMLVHESDVAMAMAIVGIVIAFKAE